MSSVISRSLPKLYSFRRCPYAIRTRLALALLKVKVDIIEVALSNKPAKLLELSPKGTVPVLELPDGRVIDESLDIIIWTSQQSDLNLTLDMTHPLLMYNDGKFKQHLDKYKYFERYPESSQEEYRALSYSFLDKLEAKLSESTFLLGDEPSLLDVAIMPFIRQFSKVDEPWFKASKYVALNRWLSFWLDHDVFKLIMLKRD